MAAQAAQTAARTAAGRDPAKVHDAAQQFEALLLGQMLQPIVTGSSDSAMLLSSNLKGSDGDTVKNFLDDYAGEAGYLIGYEDPAYFSRD